MAPPSDPPPAAEKLEGRPAPAAIGSGPPGSVPIPGVVARSGSNLVGTAVPGAIASAPKSDDLRLVRTAAIVERAPPSPSAPQVRREIAGWLTDYVTTSISVLTVDGRVERRIPREALKLPQGGLPYYKGPGGDMIVAVVGDRELILDAAEFQLRPAKPIVNETCEDLRQRGQAPNRQSPASMGHGNCR